MNVKSGCENGGGWRKPDGEAGHINMSETPFTNIETCNGELDAQATDNRSPRHTPPRLRDYYAYGVILCHSTYRKLIDGGYVVRF
jgi:hypothetical protein